MPEKDSSGTEGDVPPLNGCLGATGGDEWMARTGDETGSRDEGGGMLMVSSGSSSCEGASDAGIVASEEGSNTSDAWCVVRYADWVGAG